MEHQNEPDTLAKMLHAGPAKAGNYQKMTKYDQKPNLTFQKSSLQRRLGLQFKKPWIYQILQPAK